MLAFVAITGLHPDLTKVEVHTYYKKFDLPSSWVHFAVFNLLRILLHNYRCPLHYNISLINLMGPRRTTLFVSYNKFINNKIGV